MPEESSHFRNCALARLNLISTFPEQHGANQLKDAIQNFLKSLKPMNQEIASMHKVELGFDIKHVQFSGPLQDCLPIYAFKACQENFLVELKVGLPPMVPEN